MEPKSRIGSVIAGKYRLERLLGAGGMGAVYEAVHLGVEKRFAVKLLRGEGPSSRDAAVRFAQEARAAGRIGHPNLVEVFDLGEAEDGTLYMVMELLTGQSLAEALHAGPLSVDRALSIAIDLLGALDAAHRAGFVHRDVKPGNIFLATRADGGESVKVLDFGIAKLQSPDTPTLTQSGAVVGTPLYMAPEQVLADREIDGRADVWAVGAALFEMLTGRPVHLAPTATAAAVKVVTEPAPRVRSLRADVDANLDAVVARALAVAREQRFTSAAEMQAALDRCRSSLAPTQADSGVAPSVSSVVRAELATRTRHARLFLLGAASLVLGGVLAALVLTRGGERSKATSAPPAGSELASAPSAAAAAPRPATSTSTSTPTSTSTSTSTSTIASTSASSSRSAPRPTCPPSEHLSKGHCCPLGNEWQTDHCDRPLAKDVPF